MQCGHWLFIYGLVEKELENLFCAKCAEQLAAVYYNYYDLDTWLCSNCLIDMTGSLQIFECNNYVN
jgi:hypothetical protein